MVYDSDFHTEAIQLGMQQIGNATEKLSYDCLKRVDVFVSVSNSNGKS